MIPLTQGKMAIVDNEDFEWLSQWKWHIIKGPTTYYAARADYSQKPRQYLYMHRVIMNLPPEEEVDHIDGNGLDNRRANLRSCTHRQNCANSQKHRDGLRSHPSRFKGVSWHTQRGMWRARIRSRYLGCFSCEVEAARVYNVEALKCFGEFAKLNKVSSLQGEQLRYGEGGEHVTQCL